MHIKVSGKLNIVIMYSGEIESISSVFVMKFGLALGALIGSHKIIDEYPYRNSTANHLGAVFIQAGKVV